MPYILDSVSYPTKISVTKLAKKRRNALRFKTINKSHEFFNWFSDLINFHPAKDKLIGDGIKEFQFKQCPYVYSNTATFIIQTNGTEEIVSIDSCMKTTTQTPKSQLSELMRSVIKPYTMQYKSECDLKYCKYCESTFNLEVDHVYAFYKIRDDFLQQTKLQVPNIFMKQSNFVKIFCESDENFKNEWITYHNLHAKYQLLCKTCNLKKSGNCDDPPLIKYQNKSKKLVDGICFF